MEHPHSGVPGRHTVTLLIRAGCSLCGSAAEQLAALRDELGFALVTTDVDVEAAAGDTSLRAQYGDLLPVILLNGVEHGYWEVDEAQLRADLGAT
ncbi:glutaredoxin family protein [Mycobacterium sp. 141]|uniref:glutaredoxin family protein n=1 Tax=Mycobacterium sp. 141 TaxID=1120797 RepID=UPI000373D693|nr:glutaredoxin family protein [Mycobacterium sp. 141]